MARIPSSPSGLFAPGELRLYEALRTGLPDRITILPSQAWFGEDGVGRGEGEADLLIIDPEAGVLVVEIKGGSIACVGGAWRQGRQGGKPWKFIDPHRQASRSLHALRTLLTKHANAGRVLFGHLVWFPDADTSEAPLPPSAPRALTLDRRHLAAPAEAVAGAFAYWQSCLTWKHGGGPETVQAILDYLRPTFECGQSDSPDPPPDPPRAVAPPVPAGEASARLQRSRPVAVALLSAAKAVLWAPVRLLGVIAEVVSGLFWTAWLWAWDKFKMLLALTGATALLVGVVSLIIRLGFDKPAARDWAIGGIGMGVGALALHELCRVLEVRAAHLTTRAWMRWRGMPGPKA